MNIKRILALTLAAVLVLTMAFAGCGSNTTTSSTDTTSSTTTDSTDTTDTSTGDDADTSGIEQVINLPQPELATWDPITCTDSESSTVHAQIFEGLYQYHYDTEGHAEFVETGCTGYDLSDDSLVYTFHLREDAVWSDGEPVTAKDYVYGAKRLMDGELSPGYEFFAESIKGAHDYFYGFEKIWNKLYYETDADGNIAYNDAGEKVDRTPTDDEIAAAQAEIEALDFDANVGVKAIDDYTLEFTLAEPDGQFVYKAGFSSFYPVREDICGPIYDTYGDDWEPLVFNGPYVVTEWEDKSYGTLEKNPTYWDADSVTIERINLVYVDEDATKDKLWKEGELDLIPGSGDYLEEYRAEAEAGECWVVHSDYSNSTTSIAFNKKTGGPSGLAANPKIAKAVAYSINPEEFCQTIYGKDTPAMGYIPGDLGIGSINYRDTVGVFPWQAEREKYTDNSEELQNLFKEGLTELGLQTDDLSQYTITYMAYGDSSRSIQIQEFVKQSVESNLGITLNLNICSGWAQFLTDSQDYSLWDCYMSGWVGDYGEPMTFAECQASSQNQSWQNAEYDALIDAARKEMDPEARAQLYLQCEELLVEEAPIVPVRHSEQNAFVSNRVSGLMVGTIGYQWYVKYAKIVA